MMEITPQNGSGKVNRSASEAYLGGPMSSSKGSWEASGQCWTLQTSYPPLPNQLHSSHPTMSSRAALGLLHIHLKGHLDKAYHRLWGRALEQQTGQERGGLEEGREARVRAG